MIFQSERPGELPYKVPNWKLAKVLDTIRRTKGVSYKAIAVKLGWSTSKAWRKLNEVDKPPSDLEVDSIASVFGVSRAALAEAARSSKDWAQRPAIMLESVRPYKFSNAKILELIQGCGVIGIFIFRRPVMLSPDDANSLYELGEFQSVELFVYGPAGQDVERVRTLLTVLSDIGPIF